MDFVSSDEIGGLVFLRANKNKAREKPATHHLLSYLCIFKFTLFIIAMLHRLIYRQLFPRAFVFFIALLCCNSIAQAQWVKLSPGLIGRGPYSNQGAMASAGGV